MELNLIPKKKKNRRAAEARTNEPPKIGRLTAVFSEAIKGEGKTVQGDIDSTIQFKKDQAAVAPASVGQNAKKSFKTEIGSHTQEHAGAASVELQNFTHGNVLAEMTIYYCAAPVLIHIPMVSSNDNNDGSEQPDCKRTKREGQNASSVSVVDFTQDSDSD
jgi:hypothetical protein